MPKEIAYNSAQTIHAEEISDPYQRPAFSFSNRLRRLLWNIVWLLLFRPSPRPLHTWRAMLLRLFGAQMGPNCHIYPGCRIWAPWNLFCEDQVSAADGVEIYNPAPMHFGSHAILSQGAYVCGATHNYDDPAFPLLAYEMRFGAYCWICARASVGPGVNVGEGAVLGLASVATRNLAEWTVYGGAPAVAVKERVRTFTAGTPAGPEGSQ